MLALLSTFGTQCAPPRKYLAIYQQNGENLKVFASYWNGRPHILVSNHSRNYAIVYYVTGGMEIWRRNGKEPDSLTWQPIGDTSVVIEEKHYWRTFGGYKHTYEAEQLKIAPRIYVSSVEWNLLDSGIQQYRFTDSTRHHFKPLQRDSVLFFVGCPIDVSPLRDSSD